MDESYRDLLLHIDGSEGKYEVNLYHFPLPKDGNSAPIACDNVSLNTEESSQLGKLMKDFKNYIPPKKILKEIGKLLRKVAFPQSVCTAFCENLESSEKEGKHVRIRLFVEAEDLQSYPWEAIFIEDEKWDSFLVSYDLVSLCRLFATETQLVSLAPLEKLRVLLIGCGLGDKSKCLYPLPKLGMGLQSIENALDGLCKDGLAYYDSLSNPTKEEVEEKLKEGWHVVFYTGHGGHKGE